MPLLGIKCRSVRLTRGLITILNEVPRLLFGVRALFFVTHHRNKDVPGNVKKTRRAVEGEHNHSYPRRYMGMNGQHHVSTALNLGKEPHACRLRLKCDGTLAETRFRLSTKRTSPFKSAGASVQSTTGSVSVRISGSNAGYTIFRGSVKSTGYPHHSPVSPSLPLLYVTVCHHISTGVLTHNRHNPLLSGIRTRDPSSQAALSLRLIPKAHRGRPETLSVTGG